MLPYGDLHLIPGDSWPLGATFDGLGCNFAIYSSVATKVYLCLFNEVSDTAEAFRLPLPRKTNHVFHGYLKNVRPGQLYAFRIEGPWDPENGIRCNVNKLCLDPYAKAVARNVVWHPSMFAHVQDPYTHNDTVMDNTDNAAYAPLACVVDDSFSWGTDRSPKIPLHKMVMYETHVESITKLHPGVPEHLRGTYLGLACDCVIEHLKSLCVTSVELLPVHYHVDEQFLLERGLSNYWGYNTLSFFAPDVRFATSPDPLVAIFEFKAMVRALHAAGIEVILDVVYNHTCEGNGEGPAFHMKLADCPSYYRLSGGSTGKRYFYDFTGCGNSLNTRHPAALRLILDSLRYWVETMHVDGFRFDLASALVRDANNKVDSFWVDVVNQDPVLSRGVKLIAEPWDCSPTGYLVGKFSTHWQEWNGRYRDSIRSFWNSHCPLSEFSCRMSGSTDLYHERAGRHPPSSVNAITYHDGMTLQDLVSYNQKHNEANGEGNRDGESNNMSWNCGHEGPSDNPEILELRARQKRNMFATLAFSIGTPLIRGGDELSHTQTGNNNSYCQREMNYYQWDGIFGSDWADDVEDVSEKADFLDFCRQCMRIRTRNLSLQRMSYDLPHRWLNPGGHEMTHDEWNEHHARSLGIIIPRARDDPTGDTLLIWVNAFWNPVSCVLPSTLDRAIAEHRMSLSKPPSSESLISFEDSTYDLLGPGLGADVKFTAGGRASLPYVGRAPGWIRVLDTSGDSEIGEIVPSRATIKLPSRCLQVFVLEAVKRRRPHRGIDAVLQKYAVHSPFTGGEASRFSVRSQANPVEEGAALSSIPRRGPSLLEAAAEAVRARMEADRAKAEESSTPSAQ